MTENQQVEWKQSWRDEYLKWICGFANAQGGVLEIGRNDQGQAVGLSDAAKLMEDLPNKMRDTLGIKDAGIAPPTLSYETMGLMVEFELGDQAGTKLALSRHQAEILAKCFQERSLTDLMQVIGRSDRTKFRDQVLYPMLHAGLIEMTIPNKPKSPNQKYRITAQGRAALQELDNE